MIKECYLRRERRENRRSISIKKKRKKSFNWRKQSNGYCYPEIYVEYVMKS